MPETTTITNPILPGFNPDPSVCRVGDDYYVATSTFEWFPGIQIHHSRDLRQWQLVHRPLDRAALVNMLGCPDSCGVWAPCLSYAGGRFFLAYTDVKRFDGNFKDTHNYLTTSESIEGPWSDPVYLNSSGFDPSFFHDDDGRTWYVNMVWDHRPNVSRFRGIVLQEYLPDRQSLSGEPRLIFEGTELDCTEAPHLYKRNGWYYLMTAEGGTGYDHAITMARSRNIDGPYEVDPRGSVVTCRDDPDWPLQRAGHGDIVETPDGDLYLYLLTSRPLPGTRLSPLGRETSIQKLEYTQDEWFRLEDGGVLPQIETEITAASPVEEGTTEIERDDFDSDSLDSVYQWLRSPWPEEFMSLSDRPGHLRLYGMESPGSLYRQALIARRQTAFKVDAETRLEFEPESFQQLAGLIVYYNSNKFHYLFVSHEPGLGRYLSIMSAEADPSRDVTYPLAERVPLPDQCPVGLRATIDGADLRFSWSVDDEVWQELPVTLDMSFLADETGRDTAPYFTGTFIGLCCNDLTGMRRPADFEYFSVVNEAAQSIGSEPDIGERFAAGRGGQ